MVAVKWYDPDAMVSPSGGELDDDGCGLGAKPIPAAVVAANGLAAPVENLITRTASSRLVH